MREFGKCEQSCLYTQPRELVNEKVEGKKSRLGLRFVGKTVKDSVRGDYKLSNFSWRRRPESYPTIFRQGTTFLLGKLRRR